MEKLSGLILDVYDDSDGAILRDIFPEPTDLSELEKNAHALTPEEHNALPDDAYALVLVNGDQVMKKFATIDSGNTALSVMYFLKTAHKLPEEAQKVAAQNLVAACGWYGLEAPELLKEAVTKKWIVDRIRSGAEKASPKRLEALRKNLVKGEVRTGTRAAEAVLDSDGVWQEGTRMAGKYRKASDAVLAKQSSAEKTALDIQKQKKNLDDAPDRPQKFPTHGDGYKKTAGVAQKGVKAVKRGVDILKGTSGKKARGRSLELLSEAEKRTPSMEAIRGGAKWSTPSSRRYGKASRNAGFIADKEEALTRTARIATAAGTGGAVYGAVAAKKKTAGIDKEALGLMGAAMGALTIPEHLRTAKGNLAATKGAQGGVMTPAQVQQRKAQMGMV